MKTRKILFITNGHGEDIVAAQVISCMSTRSIKIDVLPIVGNGGAFKGTKVNIIGPKKALPSGGFGLRNYSFLIRDLFAGLIGKVISQVRLLRKSRGKYDLVVAVGDIVPLIYSSFTASRTVFLGINKSEYYRKLAFNYTGLEKRLLKKYCELVLTRDKKTADALRSQGIKAEFIGNPMMDSVQGIRRSNISKGRTIGFLPGTREDAYKNIEDFYMIAWRINRLDKNIRFVMSFPSMLDKTKLARIKPIVEITPIEDFRKVLSSSQLIIGLSGTGNEQAAGTGLPVIAFPGRGAQFNFKFAAGQKELLGDALLLMPRNSEIIAHEAIALLYNKKRMVKMGKEGRVRMGKPGASRRIALKLIKGMKKKDKKC